MSILNGQTNFTCVDLGQTFAVNLLVTDAVGNSKTCTAQVTIADDINPCCDIAIMGITSTNETCSYGNDGTATVIATCGSCDDGVSDIEYSFDGVNFHSSNILTGMATGTYSITVRDANNPDCLDVSTNAVTITEPTPLVINTQPQDVATCNRMATFTVTMAQGIAPYTYEWQDTNGNPIAGAANSPNYTFLPVADDNCKGYQVMITDAIGCHITSAVAHLTAAVMNTGPDETICQGESTTLGASSNNPLVEWTASSGTMSCTRCENPTVSPTVTTTYTMTTRPAIFFKENFAQGVAPTDAQADNWCAFRSCLRPTNDYLSLTIKGSQNNTGITLTNPFVVADIAAALRKGTPTIGGNTWNVFVGCSNIFSQCNSTGGVGLNVNGVDCICAAGENNYTVRPEIGNENWGGISGTDCNATSQSLEVIFELNEAACSEQMTVTVDVCEPECPNSYLLTGPQVVDYDFETDGTIYSNQVINGSIQVDYDAGECIDLLPGFEVRLGTEFDAFIDGCNDGFGGNQLQTEDENK